MTPRAETINFHRRCRLVTPVGLRPPCVTSRQRHTTTAIGRGSTYPKRNPVQTIPATSFRRRQDGAEIIARMSETARRHITVEQIDIARQAGVEERRLIQRGLAASDQRAAAWGAVFLELVAQRGERSTRQGRD